MDRPATPKPRGRQDQLPAVFYGRHAKVGLRCTTAGQYRFPEGGPECRIYADGADVWIIRLSEGVAPAEWWEGLADWLERVTVAPRLRAKKKVKKKIK